MQASQLRALLEADGRKMTPPRERILDLLAEWRGCFTSAKLEDALDAAHPGIGRATLFRTLDLLISVGALERVRLPGGQEGYVLCGPPHHHHVVCSSCGAVGEVEAEVLEKVLASAVRASGFALEGHALELTGVCAPCRETGPRALGDDDPPS